MFEAAQFLALCSAALLMASLAVWGGVLRGPLMQRLDGLRATNDEPAQLAIRALAMAFGLSAAAAIMVVAELVSP